MTKRETLLATVACAAALLAAANGASTRLTALAPTGDAPPQAGEAKLMVQEDAREELAKLNKRGSLIVPGLGRSMYSGGDLKKENCFGILLPNAARVLGESKGKDYGFDIRPRDRKWVPEGSVMRVLGFLFIEGQLEMQGKSLSAGPYVVVASGDHPFFGRDRPGSQLHLVRSRSLDDSDSVDLSGELSKQLEIDGSGRATAPRLTAIIEDQVAFLEVGGNRLRITAR